MGPGITRSYGKTILYSLWDQAPILTSILSGVIIAYAGFFKIWELWEKLAPLFPITVPSNVSHLITNSGPQLITIFINVVGSISAFLMGLVWIITGILETFRRWNKKIEPGPLYEPVSIIESLISSRPSYWLRSGWIMKRMGRLWPRLRLMTPLSGRYARRFLLAVAKLSFLSISLVLVHNILCSLPLLLRKYFELQVDLVVPSINPILTIIASIIVVLFSLMIAVVPFRYMEFSRLSRDLRIRGNIYAQLFFALVEEEAKLLTTKDSPNIKAWRVVTEDGNGLSGTLVEVAPRIYPAVAWPIGVLLLPMSMAFYIWGFFGLIYFHSPLSNIGYQEFFVRHSGTLVYEVGFYLALVLSGGYWADLAGKLCRAKKFKSKVLLCAAKNDSAGGGDNDPISGVALEDEFISTKNRWTLAEDFSEDFLMWVKKISSQWDLKIRVWTAEMETISLGSGYPRYLSRIDKSMSLDKQVEDMLERPFQLRLNRIPDQSRGN
jgi:hypothetical protein